MVKTEQEVAQLQNALQDPPILAGEMQFLNSLLINANANANTNANNNNTDVAAVDDDQTPLKISEKTGVSFKRAKQLILPAAVF